MSGDPAGVARPEDGARELIDRRLEAAGWVLQDHAEFNRQAARGVAVREFPLPSGTPDYLLFVDGKAAGAVEAKRTGTTLSGFEEQSEKYVAALPEHLAKWADPLPFAYETTDVETSFRGLRDPKPRSRPVFAFHRPETLAEWLGQTDTLRARLAVMPPLIEEGLRGCQIEAVEGLERSLAADRPRALIQMATGSGKTFAACTFIYRLIKHAGAKRVLFLVDRTNLGDQTLREFQGYRTPGDGRAFTALYNVQHLQANRVDPVAKVVITTIQRLYSMLRGEAEFDPTAEEESLFERPDLADAPERPVGYSPALPIETFDFIVTDECHRSIYKTWRQVLEYFDAFIVGLTATPSKQTLGFFNQNLVTEYPYERSVADGVNVGYEVYRIKTEVSEHGGRVEAGYTLGYRDRRTRRVRWEELDQEFGYQAADLDRSVTNPNQIRTILEAYRDRLKAELFPDRKWVPKTLVFAKDDNHAEEIVRIAREVFDEGNEFCKKITYTSRESPKELIKRFRIEPMPRIAVTVDMVATGTDVKPIEVLLFMRDVKSELYYEQMKGRGARTIEPSDLKQVTPDARAKTRFVLIDAVGVTESNKGDSQPLEWKKTVGFAKLLEQIAEGARDDDSLSSLAGRLAALDREIGPDDRRAIMDAAGGKGLPELANALLDAIDPDRVERETAERFGPEATEEQRGWVEAELKDAACAPFDSPTLRRTLADIKARAEIAIDEVTQDRVTYAGYDVERARTTIERFRAFIDANRDELTALQILLGRPYGRRHLTYAAIRELAEALTRPPWHLDTAMVWEAYRRLEASKVRGSGPDRLLTDIVSLVRFASGRAEVLEPFSVDVERRFNLWVGRRIQAGRTFSEEQMAWLELIKAHIAANAEVTREDLQEMPDFADRGGLLKARRLFGAELDGLVDDLTDALVA